MRLNSGKMNGILRNLTYCTRGQARGKTGFHGSILAFIPCDVNSTLAVVKKKIDLRRLWELG